MCKESTALLELKDIVILILGFLLSVFWTYLLYKLKPNLDISSVETDGKILRITITNKGCFAATNLQVEACTIKEKNDKDVTYHFTFNKGDFLFLPNRKEKTDQSYFRVFCTADFKSELIGQNPVTLRVRIHATHEFSGFGKAFEQNFLWNGCQFMKIL